MFENNKLSTKSAIFLSLTSMVGAGIFIKAKSLNELAHNNINPIIALFIFFLLNIFGFCYVLVQIIPSQKGNMGFMGWSYKICSPKLHGCFCNFMRHFYHPISLMLFAVYAVIGMTGGMFGVFATMFLSFFLVFVFMFINFLSFKWAHGLQIILSILVVIPLFVLPIAAFASPGSSENVDFSQLNTVTGLDSFGPWMILVSGLPSLLFIYDGFYGIATLKDKLQKPKNLSFVILVSIALVTIIYLNVIVSFNLGDPAEAKYENFRFLDGKPVLRDLFSILISCASLLTLNSIAMSSIPQLMSMNDNHRFQDVAKIKKTIFYKNMPKEDDFEDKFTIWIYLMFKTFVWFLIAGFISFFIKQYGLSDDHMVIIDALTDIVTVFVFLILLCIILGSIKRKNINSFSSLTKFKICSMFSGGVIILALLYLILSYLVGVTGFAGSDVFNSWVKLFLIVVFVAGCSYGQLKDYLYGKVNKKRLALYPKYRKGSIIILK